MVQENDTITFKPLLSTRTIVIEDETVTIEETFVNDSLVLDFCVPLWAKIEW
jgi:hypothetical protein